MKRNNIYKGNCIELLNQIPDESIDIILTDPPYLYLKNQKLDKAFDEATYFNEAKRVLKKDGFIVLFGRGESFYRWNTLLAGLGFTFKEEIVWNKSHCTSPLMNLSRVHETISIHTKGSGTINKVKVPYLEMKKYDLDSVIGDVKRMRTVLKNTKSLNAVLSFLENNKRDISDNWKANNLSISSKITKEDRSVSVMRSIREGMNEKSIIRTDREHSDNFTKYAVTSDKRKSGDRCATVMQSMSFGMNEKSIIKEVRDHYKAIHPTQKPVKLLKRLLALVLPKNVERPLVLDTFAGSCNTAIASMEMDCDFICTEIDEEYYNLGSESVDNYIKQTIQTKCIL